MNPKSVLKTKFCIEYNSTTRGEIKIPAKAVVKIRIVKAAKDAIVPSEEVGSIDAQARSMAKKQKHKTAQGVSKVLKRLYTIQETGVYLGRSAWSVRELIWSGKLPYVRVGKRIHLDIQDLDKFIEEHKTRFEY